MAGLNKSVASNNPTTVERMSRDALLEWINLMVNGNYDDIEELCSGVAYCQIIEKFSPKSIVIKNMKVPAKFEYERLHNLRILQNALHHLKAGKVIPIGKLVKARFLENFHFLQWFKKFYDNQIANKTEEVDCSIIIENKSIAPLILKNKYAKTIEIPFDSKSVLETSTMPSEQIVSSESDHNEICPDEEIIELTETFEQLQTEIIQAEWQRTKAINLLTKIQKLLRKSIINGEDVQLCKKVLYDVYLETDCKEEEDAK